MKKLILAAILVVLILPALAAASTVVLEWDPNTEADLAGYKVYYSNTDAQPFTGTGATQGPAPVIIPKGTNTATLSGMDPTKAYYFAITAYNTAGMESLYSNIVNIPKFPAIPHNLRIITIVAAP